MRAYLIVAVALACVALSHSVPVTDNRHHGERLIQFNETTTVWMTQQELFAYLAKDPECAGFMDITDHQHVHPSHARHVPVPTKVEHASTVKALINDISVDNIVKSIEKLSSYAPSRYYDSKPAREAALWLKSEYERAAETHKHSHHDITVELFEHSWEQPSIITRVRGSGPNAHEVVILGGHIDSINNKDPINGVAPGADDDASGSSTVLEIFRAFIASGAKPSRTVEFHAYAAEEVGLRGSQDIADDYIERSVQVAAMLQLDMTFFRSTPAGKQDHVSFVTDYVNPELTAFLRKLVDEYCDLPWQDTKCGYACSDHASWNKGGYPSAFPFETDFVDHNPSIHTPEDKLNKLDTAHGLEYAKLAMSFIGEYSA